MMPEPASIALEEMPLNSSGKVDRRALRPTAGKPGSLSAARWAAGYRPRAPEKGSSAPISRRSTTSEPFIVEWSQGVTAKLLIYLTAIAAVATSFPLVGVGVCRQRCNGGGLLAESGASLSSLRRHLGRRIARNRALTRIEVLKDIVTRCFDLEAGGRHLGARCWHLLFCLRGDARRLADAGLRPA